MNIGRMKQLRDHLASVDTRSFNMGDYLDTVTEEAGENWCGTVGCIAGHAVMVANPSVKGEYALRDLVQTDWDQELTGERGCVHVWARRWLGLERAEARALFEPMSLHLNGLSYGEVTRAMALEMLDLCIKREAVKGGWWSEAIDNCTGVSG